MFLVNSRNRCCRVPFINDYGINFYYYLCCELVSLWYLFLHKIWDFNSLIIISFKWFIILINIYCNVIRIAAYERTRGVLNCYGDNNKAYPILFEI